MLFSVVIAEDHDVTREGVRAIIETRMEGRVDATTRNGLEVYSLLSRHNPDLLILDLGLPSLNGLDVLQQVQKKWSDLGVLILSIKNEDEYVVEALNNGALGYVLKGTPASDLMGGIRAVVQGSQYLGEGLSDALFDRDPAADQTFRDRYDLLTERERQVLQLTAEGLTSKEIGEVLFISHRTVDTHRRSIREKLDLRNCAEMVRYALKHSPNPDGNGEISV